MALELLSSNNVETRVSAIKLLSLMLVRNATRNCTVYGRPKFGHIHKRCSFFFLLVPSFYRHTRFSL